MNVDAADISYQSIPTAGEKRNLRQLYLLYLLATALAALFLILLFTWLLPYARDIFADFKTDLPLSTQWTFTASAFLRDGGWLLFIPPVLAIPLLPAKITLSQTSGRAGAISAAVYFLLLFVGTQLVAGFVTISILFPLKKLMLSISGA